MSKLLMNKPVVIATWVVAAWVALFVFAGLVWDEHGMSVVTGLAVLNVMVTLMSVGVALPVITALKGKWGLFWLGFLPLSPTHFFGATRLAMPGSWWYLNRYDGEKQRRADERHAPKPNAVLEAAE